MDSTREAFVVAGVRTPIGRYGGALSGVRPDDLAAGAIDDLLKQVGQIPGDAVEEVVLGCVNQAGEDNRNVGRMPALPTSWPSRMRRSPALRRSTIPPSDGAS
jgi:acetyl-CoA acetyltransferase